MVTIMKRKIALFATFLIFVLTNIASASPKRIMSLTPVGTEILFALGEGEHIVGVTRFCDYPKEAKSKPVLSNFAEINYETILRAKVDLVVLQDMHEQACEGLEALGIKYVIVRQNSIRNIMKSILQIGDICGKEKQARALVAKMQNDISKAKKKSCAKGEKTVLICVSRDIAEDEIYNLYVAGSDVFYNELLEIIGVKNIMCESPLHYPFLTIDSLMTIKPDVIFDLVGTAEKSFGRDIKQNEIRQNIKKTWQRCLRARNLKTKVVPLLGTKFLRPGPRIGEILRAMSEELK